MIVGAFKYWKLSALIMCILFGLALAQNASQPRSGPPISVAEKLRQNHVSLTIEGLTNALQSKSAEIRFLAAVQLAYEGATETIPEMRRALDRENDPLARINIAYALAQLGNRDGLEGLKNGCSDSELPAHLRLVAARYLLDLHNDYCISRVLDILQVDENPADRMQALSLLPRFEHLAEDDKDRVSRVVVAALQDSTPAVRISAGEVMSLIGMRTDEAYIKAAIDRENDEVVRSQLQSDLQRLQKKYEKK